MKLRVAKKIYRRIGERDGAYHRRLNGSRESLAISKVWHWHNRGCQCPTAPRGHTKKHSKCEYHDHHCDTCHGLGICTQDLCLLNFKRAA